MSVGLGAEARRKNEPDSCQGQGTTPQGLIATPDRRNTSGTPFRWNSRTKARYCGGFAEQAASIQGKGLGQWKICLGDRPIDV